MLLIVQVRHVMAQALCVPVTEHTFGDLMLSERAQELGLVRSHAPYVLCTTANTNPYPKATNSSIFLITCTVYESILSTPIINTL